MHDHFHPELALDPQEQKRLHVHLEQVDAATFDANRQVLARSVGKVDVRTFRRLALAAANARANWVSAALHITEKSASPTDADIARLSLLRAAYDELTQVYDGVRRLVERGYLCDLDLAPTATGVGSAPLR